MLYVTSFSVSRPAIRIILVLGLACAVHACGENSEAGRDVARTTAHPAFRNLAATQGDFAKSVDSALSTAAPVDDPGEIAGIGLSPQRANAIARSGALGSRVSSALGNGYLCSPEKCICSGDVDCNDMFTKACPQPTPGDRCWTSGSSTICTCDN